MSVAFAPDGGSVASADAGGEVVLWDIGDNGGSKALVAQEASGPSVGAFFGAVHAALTLWSRPIFARTRRARRSRGVPVLG
jgi:hypothetical protein